MGFAGWSVAVELHPVRDRVSALGWLVVRAAEAHTDLGDEPLLLLGVTAGKTPPRGRSDQCGDVDSDAAAPCVR